MKKFTKTLSVALASVLVLFTATACAGKDDTKKTDKETEKSTSEEKEKEKSTSEEKETEKPAEEGLKGKINVYSRDASSGTRGAFQDIIGFGNEKKGQKVLLDNASIVDSNGALAAAVGKDAQAIGYVSLTTDFEANGLKAIAYEGVEPSEEAVLDGSYSLKRPFNMVTRAKGDFGDDKLEQLVAAFVDFLMNSQEGRLAVSEAGGIVDVEAGKPWEELKANHSIVEEDNSGLTLNTAGSTSVEKTIKAALEAFQPLAGNFKFAMNQTGSGDGFKRVLGGEKDGANAAQIGFASRDFKDDETVADGMASGAFCQDAVVVVVEKSNPLSGLTKQQVHDIFTGEVTNWEDIA